MSIGRVIPYSRSGAGAYLHSPQQAHNPTRALESLLSIEEGLRCSRCPALSWCSFISFLRTDTGTEACPASVTVGAGSTVHRPNNYAAMESQWSIWYVIICSGKAYPQRTSTPEFG